MKKPTQEQINEEVKTLKEYKTKIPSKNFFGDDNIAKINAEITTLEEGLDQEEIDDKYTPDETAEEYRESDHEVHSAATYAYNWTQGDEKESPSEGWKPLLKK